MAEETKQQEAEQPEKTYSAAEYTALQEQLDAARTSLKETAEKLSSFEKMDNDGIKQSAADWQQKYEQAEADRKAKEYRDNVAAFVRKQCMKNDVYAEYLTNQIISKQLQFDDKGNLTGGTETMQELKKIDEVAYVRFASVYRQFADVESFFNELKKLMGDRKDAQ